MSTFTGAYAGAYDSLYRDKDYAFETAFLLDAFPRLAQRNVETVLDFGCGTGGHAIPLALAGKQVTGVDLAPEMVEQARAKAAKAGVAGSASFEVGDLETFDAGRTFDAVICLFAVMSYQTSNAAVLRSLLNMKRHLKPDGVLICDFWYGPSVLLDPPSDRFKIVEEPDRRFIRLSHPTLHAKENRVTIDYRVLELRGKELASETTETHNIRYFFPPELENFLVQTGFVLQSMHPSFRPNDPLTANDWTVMIAATP